MYRVSLLCQDALLRQRLRECLERAGFTVCMYPCGADAVVVSGSPLTPTQVEVLQAYVDTGDVGKVARLRGCSKGRVWRHLARLVHIAWVLELLWV